jgi:hypothetical protein
MEVFKRLLSSAIIVGCLISPALTPVYSLDYEAKPVHWVLTAPFKAVGAVSGAAVCGLISAPADDGFHAGKRATTHIAGSFGDEKGKTEQLAAAPVGYPAGFVVGGVRGVGRGLLHGAKKGWDKPFSRWSFVTTEEK